MTGVRAERRPLQDAQERVASLAVLLALVIYVWALLTQDSTPAKQFLHDDGAMLVYVAVAGRLLLTARRTNAGRGYWALLATTMLVFAAAMGAYYFDLQAEVAGHRLALGDLIWVLAYPPGVIGVSGLILRLMPRRDAMSLLELAMTGVGAFAVTVALLSHFMAEQTSRDGLATAITVLPVYFDVMLLATVLAAVQRMAWRPPRSAVAFLASTVLFAVGDSVYAVMVGTGAYISAGVVDLTWPLSAVGFAFAASRIGELDAAGPIRTERNPSVAEPIAFVVTSVALVAAPIGGAFTALARIVALVTIVLAALQLRASVRSAATLVAELRVARIDSLTGMANRRGLIALGDGAVAGATVVCIGLDGLREITGKLGTQVSDQVLLEIRDRVLAEVRVDDVVARTADDELCVVLKATSERSAVRIARALVSAVERDLRIGARVLHLSACAGVSVSRHSAVGVHELISEAESALSEARKLGSGIVRAFLGQTDDQSQEQIRMRTRIKDLLHNGADEFVPYFQPIVDVSGREVYAVEALVRWHRADDVLAPGTFLGQVERSGSMEALTRHMMLTGLGQLRAAQLDYAMTINVPPDLVGPELVSMIEDALRISGSDRRHLIVEITEHAIVRDAALAAEVLGGLRRTGIRVLLDDFGTGWSGLSSLRDLSVDGIKFDGSFISAMWTDRVSSAIVRGVAQVADELGIEVVYEGVEEPAELAHFAAIRSGAIQGYAICHPLPIAELQAWALARALAVPTAL